jgi:DNA-binding transcriptional ArsR family regulator
MATDPPRETTLRLQDPRDIRALAHPARMAIVDALATGREMTATECAELTGLSPSATAYHLKFLERYDFAEPAPAREDGRERPWRATARRKSFALEPSTPAGAAAAAAVTGAFFDRTRVLGEAFLATEHLEPEEWQHAAVLASSDLWLTADEAQALSAAFAALLEDYRGRERADLPDDSRRVRVVNVVVPHRRDPAA